MDVTPEQRGKLATYLRECRRHPEDRPTYEKVAERLGVNESAVASVCTGGQPNADRGAWIPRNRLSPGHIATLGNPVAWGDNVDPMTVTVAWLFDALGDQPAEVWDRLRLACRVAHQHQTTEDEFAGFAGTSAEDCVSAAFAKVTGWANEET